MVDIQPYFHMKLLECKKRPPLQDISNKQPIKKQKECGDEIVRADNRLVKDNRNIPSSMHCCETIDLHTYEIMLPTTTIVSESMPIIVAESSATSPCWFDKLPVEILVLIISYLPCQDTLNAKRVCMLWERLARDSCFKKVIFDDLFVNPETEYAITADYMRPHFQREITPSMRTILIDWLVEVTDEFMFHPETLFLCVNYLDRYLSVHQVPRSKLQLVGVVCLIIAAKFEEIEVPRVEEFVLLSDNAYTREEVFAVEIHILAKLEYLLVAATPRSFLAKYLATVNTIATAVEKAGVDKLANYLIRLSALDYTMVRYPPSLVAASAVCLALHTYQFTLWVCAHVTHTLVHATKRSTIEKEMQQCVSDLYVLFEHGSEHDRAVYKKFISSFENERVPTPPDSLPRLAGSFLLFHQ